MILRLAEQLDVPLRERNRLLLAAGFAPRYAERPLDGDALSPPATRSAGSSGRTSRTPRGLAPHIVNLAEVRALLRIRIGRQLVVAPSAELTALYEELLAPGAGREDARLPIETEIAFR